MTGLVLSFKRFWADESGATAIEYGLIASLVVVTLIVAFTALGNGINNLYNYVVDTSVAAMSGAF
jgi:pilus assembly protein Flp/PilA